MIIKQKDYCHCQRIKPILHDIHGRPFIKKTLRDLSEISREGRGWKQRESHNFLRLRKGRGHEKWAVKRGRVMQIYARDHLEVHPQKKKEVLYLAKKERKTTVYGKLLDINCEVL